MTSLNVTNDICLLPLFHGGVQLEQSEKKSPFVFNEEKKSDDIKLLNDDRIV